MRLLASCLAVVSMVLAGCAAELTEEELRAAEGYGSHEEGGHGAAAPRTTNSMPSEFHTWRELADTVGCTARLQGRADDFRHAACVKDGDTIVFLDFDSVEGQRDWLDSGLLYGGVYLVGERWVLSGRSREYMESLRPELGGDIEEALTHGGGAS
ncbi:hypothetical protein [Actinophytocola gossypii]|uniref:Lipoprotein n=1 Tax=Actinophytocola gossypii TaxID=2812003 RepID=A0ABT2JGE1_9PSEU|nr:hypothetical protein [Actinophytocola gossypii]MCT2586934.1 hypothetical protein [Actinophytocola gossypii]